MNNPMKGSYWIVVFIVFVSIGLYAVAKVAGIWKSVAIFVGGALAGFVLAASSGLNNSEESSTPIVFPHLANRSTCPISSVWGSSRRIYHTMTSPYRQTLMPSHCFKTVKEAEEAGFRPPASR